MTRLTKVVLENTLASAGRAADELKLVGLLTFIVVELYELIYREAYQQICERPWWMRYGRGSSVYRGILFKTVDSSRY